MNLYQCEYHHTSLWELKLMMRSKQIQMMLRVFEKCDIKDHNVSIYHASQATALLMPAVFFKIKN